MSYKLSINPMTGNELIYRESDSSWIPKDEANTDYQQYLAWLAEGNTPEPWGEN